MVGTMNSVIWIEAGAISAVSAVSKRSSSKGSFARFYTGALITDIGAIFGSRNSDQTKCTELKVSYLRCEKIKCASRSMINCKASQANTDSSLSSPLSYSEIVTTFPKNAERNPRDNRLLCPPHHYSSSPHNDVQIGRGKRAPWI